MIKIEAQYHARKVYDKLPPITPHVDDRRHVGIIGCGNFAYSNIAYYLQRKYGDVIRGAMDIDINRAASLYKKYRLSYYTNDAETIIKDPAIDIIYIASNHATHAEYAVQALEHHKHVHIEKPHVVSQEQLDRLVAAMRQHPQSKVFLGFNRPKGRLFPYLQEMLARELGPLMINWFVAGHEIQEGHWYFDEKEGGRVLGNLCHWTDLTLHLVTMEKAFPCTIVPATPAGAKSDFVVSVIFADRSCASITFSAKGHTFEGVREVLNVHKGDILANLTDFQTLTLDVVEKKKRVHLRHRDHGHGANIFHSLDGTSEDGVLGEDISYVAATAKFFLAIRQAIDSGETVDVSWEDITGAAE
jgi:predicted dehydrogenase